MKTPSLLCQLCNQFPLSTSHQSLTQNTHTHRHTRLDFDSDQSVKTGSYYLWFYCWGLIIKKIITVKQIAASFLQRLWLCYLQIDNCQTKSNPNPWHFLQYIPIKPFLRDVTFAALCLMLSPDPFWSSSIMIISLHYTQALPPTKADWSRELNDCLPASTASLLEVRVGKREMRWKGETIESEWGKERAREQW